MTSCESQVPDRYGLQVFWKRRRGREKLMAEIRRAASCSQSRCWRPSSGWSVGTSCVRMTRIGVRQPAASDRSGPDHFAAAGGGTDERGAGHWFGRPGAGDRDRLGLPGGGAGRDGRQGLQRGDHPQLADLGGGNLRNAGYHDVELRTADGSFGWEEHAPYDAIIVTAAASRIPRPLIPQLRIGGRLVVPVGSSAWDQTLWVVERTEEGETSTNLGPVRFVPLTGDGQYAAG